MEKPSVKPQNPCFSSGPCAKRPGWSLQAVDKNAMLGRSHRAGPLKAQLKEVIEKHRELLDIPADYKIGIVPASDTGAFEMALWSMLGARPVDVFAWESFSQDWLTDVAKQLRLEDVHTHTAEYGGMPDLGQANPDHDTVFVWNGTTSGVRIPDHDWIAADRKGLTFCDATSAVFAYEMEWDKLDVTTWSWQKVLGGEAAHGMIVLSPRAVERLETYTPPRGLPKIFRMTKGGKLNEDLFEGATINTPSMLAVADCLDALGWVAGIGGRSATIARSKESFGYIEAWLGRTPWAQFLAEDPATRSRSSVQFKINDPQFLAQSQDQQWDFVKKMCTMLEQEDAAYDIKSHRNGPPGIRIWCGATVEPGDVKSLLPWLDWAYAQCQIAQAA